MAAATATAAGARTTDSEGVKLPSQPWELASASTQDARARAHRRAAQVRRRPVPSNSGRAEAPTRSQTTGERAVGPMAKRTTSPQLGAVAGATGRPKMLTAWVPASAVPTAQGAARRRATATAGTATPSSRPGRSAPPTTSAPTSRATATTSTRGSTAGAKDDAAAIVAPSRAMRPRRVNRHPRPSGMAKGATLAAWASWVTMNGKAA